MTTPKRHIYPKYMLQNSGVTTARQWEALHRRRLKTAQRALTELRLGCAFSPAYQDIAQAYTSVAGAIERCRYKRWTGAPGRGRSLLGGARG